MDLPWHGPYGIVDGQLSPRTARFLEREGHRFSSAFVSWQPADRGPPRVDVVKPAFDAFFERVPHARRCLHTTALNLAGTNYDRSSLIRFVNELIALYDLAWINEDLGFWTAGGWSLPYPEAPWLTEEAVAHCAAVCHQVDDALDAPLVVEFPGYATVPPGPLDAFDAFREVIERSGCACNLDTGHLLTWRWLQGHRGEALLEELDRLPLDHTVELHCAGVILTEDRMVDAHHGVLHPIQLELVRRLIERCPNLQAITYEDPKFDEDGRLPRPASDSLDALEQTLIGWSPRTETAVPEPKGVGEPSTSTVWDDALQQRFLGPEGASYRRPLPGRRSRGLDSLSALYGPQDDAMIEAFLRSEHGRAWSEAPWAAPGLALEDAFGRFVAPGGPAHLSACATLLALHPEPSFEVPEGFFHTGAAWVHIDSPGPMLFAAATGRVLKGPISPLVAGILRGEQPDGSVPVVERLTKIGLLADRPGSTG